MTKPKIPKSAFVPLADLLAEYGFDTVKGGILYNRLYRKGDLYVGISVSFYHRDYPFYCRVSLGEGSTEWPETDWNCIALWQLVEAKAPDHYVEGV